MSKSLASMTGYARGAGHAAGANFVCELKSVNGRGLDIRMRLAPGLDALEAELRRRIGAAITRGSVTLNLSLDRAGSGGEVVINSKALATVLEALKALAPQVNALEPSLDGILGLRGVLEQRDTPLGPEEEEALHAAILACVDHCVEGLVQSRHEEGQRLGAVLLERLNEIEALTAQAEQHPSRSREVIVDRLRQQVADLMKSASGFSEERLAQEAMLLATKADIREELDRLSSHIASARTLIRGGGAVGRKLDFLSQEFNREANTLCSKSNAVELTGIGLDLKAVIDQLREQVQNIE